MTAVSEATGDLRQSLPRASSIPGPRAAVVGRTFSDIDVIIPAFNEAVRLPRTLDVVIDYLSDQPWHSRIVVVDNGSSDDTARVVRSRARSGRVALDVIGCSRPGKGAAVRRGLLDSRARFVGFLDADLATPVETLGTAVAHLERGAAAVIASRYGSGAALVRPQPMTRRIGGAAFRRMTRPLVPGVRDTQCGFKFFQRAAVGLALAQCRTTGFAFDVDLLRRIQGNGGLIIEVPVAWTDHPSSTFRPLHDGVASFAALLRLTRG